MATSLLSIGLLGLSKSTIELSRVAKWGDTAAAATGLAVEQLELVRSMPLTAAVTGTYNAGNKYANGAAGGPYSVTYVVSANNTPSWGLKTVTVTASWNQYGATRKVKVASFIRCSKTPC